MKPREITIRPIKKEDFDAILEVEKAATPNLQYLSRVFDMFSGDKEGLFLCALIDDEICGCGKMSVLPDGSGWVETLRVKPEYQGLGIGKEFYKAFIEIAEKKNISPMGMYTGLDNAVSKGLAERFSFTTRVAFECLRKFSPYMKNTDLPELPFQLVEDETRALDLCQPIMGPWKDYIIFNRTFYKFSPEVCAHFARSGNIYHDPAGGSLLIAGARFMPDQILNIGLMHGDLQKCLAFTNQLALEKGVREISCVVPDNHIPGISSLKKDGFSDIGSRLIVMERR